MKRYDTKFHIWPIPRNIQIQQDDHQLSISKDFQFTLKSHHENTGDAYKRIERGIVRFNSLVNNYIKPRLDNENDQLHQLEITIMPNAIEEEYPSMTTRYDYNITITKNIAKAYVSSEFAGLYAMETFVQLIGPNGILPSSSIKIEDEPQNNWRGLLIDSGRRFFPVDTVENILEIMSIVKLNVLHLHASDYCRFGVESKLYPDLTSTLSGNFSGFYAQEDIKHLIEYAADRGIRVMPEFDVPGHAAGFRPLQSQGINFCSGSKKQLYDDPEGSTFSVLMEIYKEMSELFKDEVFNIGADETHVHKPCDLNSISVFEKNILAAIESNLNKTTAGWEEILFATQAATSNTIVDAWTDNYKAHDIIETGRRAIESHRHWFYFGKSAKKYPKGWEPCWNDITKGINDTTRHLLLGGSMSMWGDSYCPTTNCLGNTDKKQIGSDLFPPEMDKEFQISVGGMIWPRGYVGAGAFWNYDESLDSQSEEFVDMIWALNDMVTERGGVTCPTRCNCDQITQCGEPISSLI